MKSKISFFIKKYKIERNLLILILIGGIAEYLPLNVIPGVSLSISSWIYPKLLLIPITLVIGVILSNQRFFALSLFIFITVLFRTSIQTRLSYVIVEVNKNLPPKEQKGVFLGVRTEITKNESVIFNWIPLLHTDTMLIYQPNHGLLNLSERSILTVIDENWYVEFTPFLE